MDLAKLELKVRELAEDPVILEAFKKIVAFEEKCIAKYGKAIHWGWLEVGVSWQIVQRLALAGLLDVIGGRRKYFLLKDRELVKRVVEEVEASQTGEEVEEEEGIEIPPDFWEPIEGYDDIKEVFLASLRSDEQYVHWPVGPQAG